MEEQNTGAETTSNYFNMENQQTGRATICPILHYKETSRPPTTNRIKRAHTANKTLYTSTLHTSIVPYRTTIQENRHKKANEMHPLHFIDRGGRGQKQIIWRITTRPTLFPHAPIFESNSDPQKNAPCR